MFLRIPRSIHVLRQSTAANFGISTIAIAAIMAVVPLAMAQTDPGPRSTNSTAASPVPGLTGAELNEFNDGFATFQEVDDVHDSTAGNGLGPRFNSNSCASCHVFPAIGGTSPNANPQIAVATLKGARNTVPPFIHTNGPVREVRFVKNPDGTPDGGVHSIFVITGRPDAVGCNITQEDQLFSGTNFNAVNNPNGNLSFRIPTPTFGLGFVEMTPDANLLSSMTNTSGPRAAAGIAGRFNRSGNDGSITRFGWKAQNKSLVVFAGEAYNVEQGVSNLVFPNERENAQGCQFNGAPEDADDPVSGEASDVEQFSEFMRFLNAPARGPITNSVTEGSNSFTNIGCALCHTVTLQTGQSRFAALNNKSYNPYSDFALHHMGSGLSDGVSQGVAGPDEFRTAPLWGVGQRLFFLHDGRTSDLLQAILAHSSSGSEANTVISRFNALNTTQKQDILNFLRSL